MVNLDKWNMSLNFKPKHVNIKFTKYSKKKARLIVSPKNGNSFPLNKKRKTPFNFKGKKITHKVVGSYTLAQSGKRQILLTTGLHVNMEKA